MGSFNNTDNLGTKLNIGDHVGYIYGRKDHYRIHSGIVIKLCDKRVWIKPDENFITDARVNEFWEEQYKLLHPQRKPSKYNKLYLSPYGRVVKLGY